MPLKYDWGIDTSLQICFEEPLIRKLYIGTGIKVYGCPEPINALRRMKKIKRVPLTLIERSLFRSN